MKKTNHFVSRMEQRGIKNDLVELTLAYGHDEGDKTILNRKEALGLIDELNQFKKTILRAVEKRGVVVVSDNGVLLTTYNYSK
jgi:hypothetical protein